MEGNNKTEQDNTRKALNIISILSKGFPGSSVVKNPSANAGDPGLIPGLGRSHGEGNGNPLWYSCLENPMDGEAWYATVHRVTKSRTQLSKFTFTVSIVPTNTP